MNDKNLIAAGFIAVIAGALFLIQLIIEYTRRFASQLWLALIVVCLAVIILALGIHFANARDLGQWENSDPAITEWYRSLMRPDVPTMSCCGEADAYWCDDVSVKDGKTFCAITDDRPDEPRGRPHVGIGTEFEIPPERLKWDRSNPTGHFIIFLSRGGFVYCFVQASGI